MVANAPEDHVARLFAADRGIQPEHLFQHVFVSHRGAQHPDAKPGQRLFEAKICHDC